MRGGLRKPISGRGERGVVLHVRRGVLRGRGFLAVHAVCGGVNRPRRGVFQLLPVSAGVLGSWNEHPVRALRRGDLQHGDGDRGCLAVPGMRRRNICYGVRAECLWGVQRRVLHAGGRLPVPGVRERHLCGGAVDELRGVSREQRGAWGHRCDGVRLQRGVLPVLPYKRDRGNRERGGQHLEAACVHCRWDVGVVHRHAGHHVLRQHALGLVLVVQGRAGHYRGELRPDHCDLFYLRGLLRRRQSHVLQVRRVRAGLHLGGGRRAVSGVSCGHGATLGGVFGV